MKVEKSKLIFSSGRVMDVYGILGIRIHKEPDLFAGYDTAIYFDSSPDDPEDRDIWPLTREERAELADFMIARWEEFKKGTA